MDTASHSLVLLQQLNMQREFGFLCDCTVAIGDVYFKAHRAVLAAFSNYFKMIFIHQTRLEQALQRPRILKNKEFFRCCRRMQECASQAEGKNGMKTYSNNVNQASTFRRQNRSE
ncbi:hypothetical protein P7K49_018190 [Saguinus oedipus]|uniref:BTB domain-containing protein n=1 Tax=Saguinus oedipus TaxID=9490 RepID=A0ABQ9V5U9_SAGOE|nr:hypothetical protein P7K49_018190 [Saguinus oedipus]